MGPERTVSPYCKTRRRQPGMCELAGSTARRRNERHAAPTKSFAKIRVVSFVCNSGRSASGSAGLLLKGTCRQVTCKSATDSAVRISVESWCQPVQTGIPPSARITKISLRFPDHDTRRGMRENDTLESVCSWRAAAAVQAELSCSAQRAHEGRPRTFSRTSPDMHVFRASSRRVAPIFASSRRQLGRALWEHSQLGLVQRRHRGCETSYAAHASSQHATTSLHHTRNTRMLELQAGNVCEGMLASRNC